MSDRELGFWMLNEAARNCGKVVESKSEKFIQVLKRLLFIIFIFFFFLYSLASVSAMVNSFVRNLITSAYAHGRLLQSLLFTLLLQLVTFSVKIDQVNRP